MTPSHDMRCPPIPTKFPLNIPKLEGKYGEYPSNHVMTCESVEIVEESCQDQGV